MTRLFLLLALALAAFLWYAARPIQMREMDLWIDGPDCRDGYNLSVISNDRLDSDHSVNCGLLYDADGVTYREACMVAAPPVVVQRFVVRCLENTKSWKSVLPEMPKQRYQNHFNDSTIYPDGKYETKTYQLEPKK